MPAPHRARASADGFTYLSAMVFVVIIGIALGTAGRLWTVTMKREREQQLLFAGDQIRRGIEAYYKLTPGGRTPEYPRRLEDLLKDPRQPTIKRYLRRLYPNPMEKDGRWKFVLDSRGAIKGVFADSKEKPLKHARFDKGYENFEKAAKYSDWKFSFGIDEMGLRPMAAVPNASTGAPPDASTQGPTLK